MYMYMWMWIVEQCTLKLESIEKDEASTINQASELVKEKLRVRERNRVIAL